MFEHLDDPQPPRSGTEQQLVAARRGGRALIHRRRRNRVAAGSMALAATAGATTVAAVGLPGTGAGAAGLQPGGTPSGPTAPSTVPAHSSGSPAAIASVAASPVPSSSVADPTVWASMAPSGKPSATTDPPTTAACTHEASRLSTSAEPEGYVRTDPGTAVIAWTNAAGPLTKLAVSVRCAPFSTADIPAGSGAFKEVVVLGVHHWVIGDVTTGHLQEVWNADNGTAVVIDATAEKTADETTAEHQMSTFGNHLVD